MQIDCRKLRSQGQALMTISCHVGLCHTPAQALCMGCHMPVCDLHSTIEFLDMTTGAEGLYCDDCWRAMADHMQRYHDLTQEGGC